MCAVSVKVKEDKALHAEQRESQGFDIKYAYQDQERNSMTYHELMKRMHCTKFEEGLPIEGAMTKIKRDFNPNITTAADRAMRLIQAGMITWVHEVPRISTSINGRNDAIPTIPNYT